MENKCPGSGDKEEDALTAYYEAKKLLTSVSRDNYRENKCKIVNDPTDRRDITDRFTDISNKLRDNKTT